MNILHVLSQTQPTGAESYALTLAKQQLKDGHSVTIVSDEIHFPTEAEVIHRPIHNRKYLQRLKNIQFLRALIHEKNIHVVHAHSRAASWVAYYSCLGTTAPLISTVHGRQHLHTSVKLHDIYGDRVIAICKNVQEHLTSEVGMRTRKIRGIPNAMDFDDLDRIAAAAKTPTANTINLAIAGRTTGPKGERTGELLQEIIPALMAKFANLHVEVFGGEETDLSPTAKAALAEVKKKFPTRFRFLGYLPGDKMYEALLRQNIVIGSGRIAIASLYYEKTVLALGEALTHGIVRGKNLGSAIASNFGDISAKAKHPPCDLNLVRADLEDFLRRDEPGPSHKSEIVARYSSPRVLKHIANAYHSAMAQKMHPKHIPVLMYHKVVDAPLNSKHRIFVTKETFAEHLSALKERGFTPLTFREYELFRTGKAPWEKFPERPVIITLDDAYLDNYTNAFPLLKKHGFSAVIFALGDEGMAHNEWDARQGEERVPLMSRAQMREMSSAGIEFGAHSMTHSHLTKLPEELVRKELVESKQKLEDALGVPVISFAYPYGDYNERIKELTMEAGYAFGVATDTGGLHLEEDPFAIFRASIFPEDGAAQIRKKASSWYRKYYFWKRGK